jgi:hypothetical protein
MLHAARVGRAEPTALAAPWGDDWVRIGPTAAGSTFTLDEVADPIHVAEKADAVKHTVNVAAAIVFALPRQTAARLAQALGIRLPDDTGGDGKPAEPGPGIDGRVMLGWDMLPTTANSSADALCRLVARKACWAGGIHANTGDRSDKAPYRCRFFVEAPQGDRPVKLLQPEHLGNVGGDQFWSALDSRKEH